MRRLLRAGLALALVTGSAACVDLNEKLVSQVNSTYIQTAQGLTDATNGIYQALRGYAGGDTYEAIEQLGTDTWMAGDQVSAGGAQNWIYLETYDAQFTTADGQSLNVWQSGYQMINNANTVLDFGLDAPVGAGLSQAIKNSRLGEAYFLRAWAYFQLVQQFGGLTVNLHAAKTVITEAKRESEDSVYKVIVSDLNQAITLLPVSQTDYGRATKGAAQDLLAKVYLTRAYREWNTANRTADFTQALTLAQSVINSGTYSLSPIYADLWCGTHRAAVPADPGRQGFCDLTNAFSERNPEIIFSVQFSYDPVQYINTAVNYQPVVFLSQYDAGANGFANGIARDKDNGRPFRRLRPSPYLFEIFNQTRYPNGQGGPGVDVLDTRFDGSFQTVWWANGNTTNPKGTCPKCTSGDTIHGTLLRDAGGSPIGAAAGSDTALVYLGYQVPDSYRMSKPYRIGTPCTTPATADCGKDNDAKGMYGYAHYPSLKKFQDNARTGDQNDQNGGKDRIALRLGETYLIAAEAALGLGQAPLAADMINVLRRRAACDPTPSNAPKLCAVSHKNDPAILVNAGQINLDFIMDEREREMSGELTRWDDLRRPGKAFFMARIKKYNPYALGLSDKHYYRPIPAQQIQGVTGTPYTQNPGW